MARVGAVLLLCALVLALSADARKKPPAHPLDLNTATAEELQQLPELGPALARAIIEFREKSGPFRRVEELLAIRGVTKRRLEMWRAYVRVKHAEVAKEARK